jgi:hypothetical protein
VFVCLLDLLPPWDPPVASQDEQQLDCPDLRVAWDEEQAAAQKQLALQEVK